MTKGVTKARLRPYRFAILLRGALALVVFELTRAEALDLLDWLGLARPEFGAIEGRSLVPRCRRRLWREFDTEENARRRSLVLRLLVSVEMFPRAIVAFG